MFVLEPQTLPAPPSQQPDCRPHVQSLDLSAADTVHAGAIANSVVHSHCIVPFFGRGGCAATGVAVHNGTHTQKSLVYNWKGIRFASEEMLQWWQDKLSFEAVAHMKHTGIVDAVPLTFCEHIVDQNSRL